MNTFMSRSVRALTFALLVVGGSVQAISFRTALRPATSAASVVTLVQKSFLASHPVLKWSGISLATGVVTLLAVERWKYHKSTTAKSFGQQIKADLSSLFACRCRTCPFCNAGSSAAEVERQEKVEKHEEKPAETKRKPEMKR